MIGIFFEVVIVSFPHCLSFIGQQSVHIEQKGDHGRLVTKYISKAKNKHFIANL